MKKLLLVSVLLICSGAVKADSITLVPPAAGNPPFSSSIFYYSGPGGTDVFGNYRPYSASGEISIATSRAFGLDVINWDIGLHVVKVEFDVFLSPVNVPYLKSGHII